MGQEEDQGEEQRLCFLSGEKLPPTQDGMVSPGDPLPDFSLSSQVGPIDLHSYLGLSWSLVYAGGEDFTAVSLTELGEIARLNGELAARKIKVGLGRGVCV